jgi:molybdate transport system substrate-binding protein
LLFATAAALTIACGDGADESTSAGAPAATATGLLTPTPPRVAGRVTVFAAASLAESFKAIGDAFRKVHPDVSIEFNFQSSSALATQIEQAAPADVFASADMPQMQRIVDKGLIDGQPVAFVRNLPVIVVPADNRAQINRPEDLAKSGVKLVLAAADVPIGNYSRQIVDRLAANPAYGSALKEAALRNIVSNEANVRAVLTKVELGEADAGIVYKTDALISGSKVKTIAIPEAANVVATYPIAVVKATTNRSAAAAFVAFVLAADGQRLLREAGFAAPRSE